MSNSSTLQNNTGVTIKITSSTRVSAKEELLRVITLGPGENYAIDLAQGVTLTAVSEPPGANIDPASTVVWDGRTITYTKKTPSIHWDPTYLPMYKQIEFSQENSYALSKNPVVNPNWYSAVGSITIPYSPAEKYVFDIEHSGSNYFGVGGPSFTPISGAWGTYGIPIGVPGGANKIRVTLDLASANRTLTYTNLSNNATIAPYGNGAQLNNQAHYPLRLVVALPSPGSWAKITRFGESGGSGGSTGGNSGGSGSNTEEIPP